MMAGVNVQNLTKRYGGGGALQGVSFEGKAGEILGLLGPNGAGKTTILECILGLRRPDEGSITVNRIDALAHPDRVKPFVGAVLQSTALQDKITPRQALRLFSAFYRPHADTGELLARLGLADKADATYDTLSGGQKQRLALALAFVNQPNLLVLDEPTAGLDPAGRHELHEIIKERRDAGCFVLLSTHQLDEAHRLCDRLAIIDRGRLVALAPPDELIARTGATARLSVRTARPLDDASLRALAGVRSVSSNADARVLTTADLNRTVIELTQPAGCEGDELLERELQRPTLEGAFLDLTVRAWPAAPDDA